MLGFLESPVAQIVVRHRRIIEANKAIERLFGYSRDKLANRSVQKLYPSTADFTQIGEKCETRMRATGDSYYEDERFMQACDKKIFWVRAKGMTLTPKDPFALMIWSFEQIASKSYRSVNLSPREREVTHHLVNGSTSREIGIALGISHRTVEVHRARLMRKFNVKNTAALISEIVHAV
ncbi:transcriptional regulatory protein TdiR [Roseovarius sp. A-2]|nr:transcriptional regulatory protein TdiR [Roseovarius sp. A-2]